MNTRDLLEQCQLRLLNLDSLVDRIRSKSVGNVWSDASPLAPPPSPAESTMPGDTQKRAVSRCHECHGPLTQYHKGFPHGVNVCNLEHYDLCGGGIKEGNDKGGHFWNGCPEGFIAHPDSDKVSDTPFGASEESLSHDSVSESESSNDTVYEPDPGFSAPKEDALQTRSKKTESGKPEESGSISGGSNMDVSAKTPSLDKEDHLLDAEIAEIARLEREAKMIKIKMKKKQAQDDLDRLQRQARGEGARAKFDLDDMHEAVDIIRSQNNEKHSTRNTSLYTGPNMDEIRRDANTRVIVDDLMDDVHRTPALSNARQSGTSRPQFPPQFGKPRLKQNSHTQPQGTGYSIASPVQKSSEQLFKWVTGVDRYGAEYRTLVEATPPPKQAPPPQRKVVVPTEPGWVYDESSGRMYRSVHQPRSQHTVTQAGHGSHSRVVVNDPHYYPDNCRQRSVSTPVRHRREEAQSPDRSYVRRGTSTDNRGREDTHYSTSEDREGKGLSLASHARNLPVEYAKSVTSKNMSFALFVYGAVSELHSSLVGLSSPMERCVLEAKLQHIMNVIHVTCLNASPTEFKPVAWSVGRTYHNLVQSKVDLGRESWSEFNHLYRGSPHAAEMVAAEREHRVALERPPKSEKGVKGDKPGEKVEKSKTQKPLCSTWNDFESEGKCRWESENPGQSCNRSHHCTYCEKKGNSKTYHQERFCKRKLPEDK